MKNTTLLALMVFTFAAGRWAAAEPETITQIKITNSVIANNLLSNELQNYVSEAREITIDQMISENLRSACSLSNIGPVKTSDVFKYYSKSISESKHFKTTLYTFQNKVGFVGFGIRCISTDFAEVTVEQIKKHLDGIVEIN